MNERFTITRTKDAYIVLDTCRPVGFNLEEIDDEYVMSKCGQEEDAALIAFALNMIGSALVKLTISPENSGKTDRRGGYPGTN